METDIVIPVWNRPVETRNCLVNLVNFTPGAKLIIVDVGSDRETESLLEEFADLLQERALLLRNDQNVGFVPAVNRGLSKVTAPLAAVVRSTSLVAEGWLEPVNRAVMSRPDAGIISPRLAPAGVRLPKQGKLQALRPPQEIDSPSFAAMFIRKQLIDRAGLFDEGLDGGEWCLRDYARRALREGWHTVQVDGSPVLFSDEAALGSTERREKRLRQSVETFRERWGEGRSWFVLFSKTAVAAEIKETLDLLLVGARQGHRFHLPLMGKVARELEAVGCDSLHESLRLYPLPRMFAERECRKLWLRLKGEEPGMTAIAVGEGALPVDEACLEFDRLEREIVERARNSYAKGGEACVI